MALPPAFGGALAEALTTADSSNLLFQNQVSGPGLNLKVVAAVKCGLSYHCRLVPEDTYLQSRVALLFCFKPYGSVAPLPSSGIPDTDRFPSPSSSQGIYGCGCIPSHSRIGFALVSVGVCNYPPI